MFINYLCSFCVGSCMFYVRSCGKYSGVGVNFFGYVSSVLSTCFYTYVCKHLKSIQARYACQIKGTFVGATSTVLLHRSMQAH